MKLRVTLVAEQDHICESFMSTAFISTVMNVELFLGATQATYATIMFSCHPFNCLPVVTLQVVTVLTLMTFFGRFLSTLDSGVSSIHLFYGPTVIIERFNPPLICDMTAIIS